MLKTIRAVYEKGVLRPLSKLALKEKQEVSIAILENPQDPCAADLAAIAQWGGTFDFLADPREDIYSPDDGEEV